MPVPPNQRRKTASVMTRPSGDGDIGQSALPNARPGSLRVTNMPHGGVVRIGNTELDGIGWADAGLTLYDLDLSGRAADLSPYSLTITDVNGVVHKLPDGSEITTAYGAYYVNFSDFVPLRSGQRNRSITDAPISDSLDMSGGQQTAIGLSVGLVPGFGVLSGSRFSITGVPSDVVGLIVQENARVLSGTLAGGTWTASSFDVSPAAVITVQPQITERGTGIPVSGRALTRTVAIPAAGLSIAYSTLAAPTTTTPPPPPPAMTGIVLVGDTNSIGGATFSLDGTAVPYAPGAAQWLPTTPAYTKLFIPAPVGAHVVRLTKGGEMRSADASVAAGQVTEIPVARMTVATTTTTPPPAAMTGIVLAGDINSIGGATFSLDGVVVPYAPGAAQWLPTTPAYTKLFIPATAGAHVVRLSKGGETRSADASVAAGQVTEIPVARMTVETRSTNQPVTNSDTGIVLVGNIGNIGGAQFSVDGVAVPYAPGAAQWLPTTPAYTKLFIPATAGARVVRLIKGGQTLIANATVAAGRVTEIPVAEMQQELIEMPKAEDQKEKLPAVAPPIDIEIGPPGPGIRTPPVVDPRGRDPRLAQPQPGMSTTSKLILGGLVAAALGGGYYWYSTQPKANPGKKGCGCGCKGGCGG